MRTQAHPILSRWIGNPRSIPCNKHGFRCNQRIDITRLNSDSLWDLAYGADKGKGKAKLVFLPIRSLNVAKEWQDIERIVFGRELI